MNSDFSCLIDPDSHRSLKLCDGNFLSSSDGESYPIVKGIPRFVPPTNYAVAFGDQRNRFPKAQLDSYTGVSLAETRLARCMQGHLSNLKGKKVLEVGSGAGRFTEILLKHDRNESQIQKLLQEIGAEDIEIVVDGNGVEAFCRKSETGQSHPK